MTPPFLRYSTCAVIAVFGLAACTTVSSSEDAPRNAQSAAAEVNENGEICRFRDVTGSNFRRKVCGTPEEWAAIERASREATKRIQDNNRGFEPTEPIGG